MHNQPSDSNWLEAIVTASIGAGIVTSFAVSQGQHPLIGIAITLFAGISVFVVGLGNVVSPLFVFGRSLHEESGGATAIHPCTPLLEASSAAHNTSSLRSPWGPRTLSKVWQKADLSVAELFSEPRDAES